MSDKKFYIVVMSPAAGKGLEEFDSAPEAEDRLKEIFQIEGVEKEHVKYIAGEEVDFSIKVERIVTVEVKVNEG